MAAPKGNKNRLVHGQRHTRLYNIWRTMKQRCSNHNCINYHNYGGKGIKVCEQWANDFNSFYKWAMANGYENGLTIDRIDTKGNYEPTNCRWATNKVQQNNKSTNRLIEYNGTSHTLSEWADITGIGVGTIWSRLKNGWDVESALTLLPVIGRNQFRN